MESFIFCVVLIRIEKYRIRIYQVEVYLKQNLRFVNPLLHNAVKWSETL